jgi:phospholipase C
VAPAAVLSVLNPAGAAGAHDPEIYRETLTPIKHLIVLIGENRSFDHVFATYRPQSGQTVVNLLSRGIVNEDGSPGPNAAAAQQFRIETLPSTYFMGANFVKTGYSPYLPTPRLGGAPNTQSARRPPFDGTISQPQLAQIEPALDLRFLDLLRVGATGAAGTTGPDTRVTGHAALPNTAFQVTGPRLSYNSYSGDTIHRFYQMWQQSDCNVKNATADNPSGCRNDLYAYVGVQQGDDSGANSMGFLNMQQGDAGLLKWLADTFTLSDNFHQAVMGGTAANHVALGTGDAIAWTAFEGMTAPPKAAIANPDPESSTSNKYQADREWSNCSSSIQPGVAAITNYLSSLPYQPDRRCQTGRFYMVNNLGPGYLPNGQVARADIVAGNRVPPSALRTIGDALNEKSISWAYYGGGYDTAVRFANGLNGPRDIPAYCEACNFSAYTTSIMNDPAQSAAHIKDLTDFFMALASHRLPAVSFVKPDEFLDGHPASSRLDLFEAMLFNIVERLVGDPMLFGSTALLVTFDEAGGYWDSGYIQPLDFFGDGPRVPLIAVSPYSLGGRIVHSYNDLVSVLKFIERNWRLRPLTSRSRDNLPNPVSAEGNPYVPLNPPAIGDLFDMFVFPPPR